MPESRIAVDGGAQLESYTQMLLATSMNDVFAFIGVAFVIFSIVAYPAVRKGGTDVLPGVFFALWALIAFGVGSWALSWIFVHGLDGVWSLSRIIHVPFLVVLASPILLVLIVGFLRRRKT